MDTALFLQSTELKLWEFILWILIYFCSPQNWKSSSYGYWFISAVHRTEAVRVHFVDTALFLQSTELRLCEFILWILLYFCNPWNQVHSSCGYCFISAVHLTERVHLVDTALFLQSTELRVHLVDTALFLQSMTLREFIMWMLLYFCSPWNQVSSSKKYCCFYQQA